MTVFRAVWSQFRDARKCPNQHLHCSLVSVHTWNAKSVSLRSRDDELGVLRPWQTRAHCCGQCCRNKCFPFCPRTQHLLRTQILCPGHKKCFLLCSEAFSATNVSQFAQPKKHHEQECVRNNVSSFAIRLHKQL